MFALPARSAKALPESGETVASTDDMDMNKITKAVRLATAAHAGQMRNNQTEPYIMHPLRVMHRVMLVDQPDVDEDVVCAAVLHDVIEDTSMTGTMLRKEMGHNVGWLVEWLTNPSKGSKLPRAERKKMDLDHIAGAPTVVRIVKLIDRADNVNSLHGAPLKFVPLYLKESDELLDTLRGTDEDAERELEFAIGEARKAFNIPHG